MCSLQGVSAAAGRASGERERPAEPEEEAGDHEPRGSSLHLNPSVLIEMIHY